MALNPNQFTQIPVAGQVDLLGGSSSVIAAAVSASASGALVPFVAGQAVKIDTANVGGIPKMLPLAANTDPVYGFVVYNIKDASHAVGTNFELALNGTYMYMTASAAILPGAALEYDNATQTVKTSAGVNPVVGFALDAASANGSLLRVRISVAQIAASGSESDVVQVTATLAQINAGLVIIPGVSGKKILVTNYTARVAGGFATGTAVILESTNATPVLVTTLAEAGLTNGAVLTPASANTTIGAGFAVPLGSGDGLQVVNSGAAQTGGTSIQFTISYSLV